MKGFVTVTLLCALAWLAGAVRKVYVEDLAAKRNLKRAIKGRGKQKHVPEDPLDLPKEEELEPSLSITLPNKDKITKFLQEFEDVPVYGSHVTAKVDKNTGKPIADKAVGVIYKGIKEDIGDIKTSVTKDKALDIAKKHNGHTDVFLTSTELMIYPKGDDAYLAYKVTYIGEKGTEVASPVTIVDAKRGTVLDSFTGSTSALTKKMKGNGGNKQIGKTEFTGAAGKLGKLELTVDTKNSANCLMETDGLKVLDLEGIKLKRRDVLTHYRRELMNKNEAPVTYPCTTETIPDRENKDAYNVANDMFYYSFHALKMFESLNLKAYDKQIIALVNYNQEDEPVGEMFLNILKFNDGGRTAYSLASYPEIVAHELAHSVTRLSSTLEVRGESGAINEAFSDMTGERFKKYIGKPNDWLFGKGYLRGKPDQPIRNMKDPKTVTDSIDHIKDYNDQIDIHDAAGIYNKAFYHLSITEGWDIERAYEVFALANRAYWGHTTEMNEGSCGVQNAGGALGRSKTDVKNAFLKVGVRCPLCNQLWCTILK